MDKIESIATEKKPSKLEQYSKKVTQDPWKVQLYNLTDRLKDEEEKMTNLITNLDPKKEAELPQEEQDKSKETFKNELAKHKANTQALKETIKEHRMNRRISSFFQWLPNKGMNRSQAKAFRKLRSEGKLKAK